MERQSKFFLGTYKERLKERVKGGTAGEMFLIIVLRGPKKFVRGVNTSTNTWAPTRPVPNARKCTDGSLNVYKWTSPSSN